jgi:hypothetical protein
LGTILFAVELGSGTGHVRRLLPLARAVAAAGHRPLFFVPNPQEVCTLIEGEGFPSRLVPTRPAPPPHLPRNRPASSFTDILGVAGFGDAPGLLRALQAWDILLAETKPAVVVCELSPFLCLACLGGDRPVVVVGHGFALPPADAASWPALVSGAAPLFAADELLARVCEAQRRRGRPEPARLPVVLAGTARFVTGLAALDPYRQVRRDLVVGPPDTGVRRVQVEPVEDVFGYLLGDHRVTPPLLAALARSGLRGSVYVQRPLPGLASRLAGSGIRWLDQPASMPQMLERCRLVVHHASMLTSEEALIAGRPQVVAPLYLEHLLTARALLDNGVAAVMTGAPDEAEMVSVLKEAVASAIRRQAAERFALSHEGQGSERRSALVRDRILALAGG